MDEFRDKDPSAVLCCTLIIFILVPAGHCGCNVELSAKARKKALALHTAGIGAARFRGQSSTLVWPYRVLDFAAKKTRCLMCLLSLLTL